MNIDEKIIREKQTFKNIIEEWNTKCKDQQILNMFIKTFTTLHLGHLEILEYQRTIDTMINIERIHP